jgi:hypothetical protein
MASDDTYEHGPAGSGALAELAREDSSRKRFLRMIGAGGAASLAVLIAACGNDDKAKPAATAAPTTASKGSDWGTSRSSTMR